MSRVHAIEDKYGWEAPLDEKDPNPWWSGTYDKDSGPRHNNCGATSAMNLFHWYGVSETSSGQSVDWDLLYGDDFLDVNNWDEDVAGIDLVDWGTLVGTYTNVLRALHPPGLELHHSNDCERNTCTLGPPAYLHSGGNSSFVTISPISRRTSLALRRFASTSGFSRRTSCWR